MHNVCTAPAFHLRRIGLRGPQSDTANTIHFSKLVTLIGRNTKVVDYFANALDTNGRNYISRIHCRIICTLIPMSFKLVDSSLTGVYVNDVRINSEHFLHEGDTVTLGHPEGANISPGTRVRQPNSELYFLFEHCLCTMEQLSADASSQEFAVSPSLNQTEDNIHAQMDTGITPGPGVFGESLSDPKSNISPSLTCTSHPRNCFEEQKQEPEPSKSTVSIKNRIMVELNSKELSNISLLSNKPCVSDEEGSYQSEEGKTLKRKYPAQAQGFSVPDPYCKIGAIDPSCDGTESAHGDGTSLSHLLQYREEECCGKRDDERIDNQSVVKCDTSARVWPESDKKSVCVKYASTEHTADSSDSPVAHAFLQLDTNKKNQTKACISSSVCLASSEKPLQAQVISCKEKPVHIYKDNPPLPACILSSMIQEDVELKKRHQNEEIPNSGSVSPVVVPLMTVMSIEPCTIEKEPQDKAIGERIAYMSKQAEDLDLCSAVGKSIEEKQMQMEPSVPCEQAVMHLESNGDEKKQAVSLNQAECRGNRVSNELLGVCHPSNGKEAFPSRENVSSVVMREASCGSGSPPPLQLVQCREDATANVLLKKDTNETAEIKVEVEQNNHNDVYYSLANETDELCRVNKEPQVNILLSEQNLQKPFDEHDEERSFDFQIVNVFSLSPSINLHSLDKTSGSTECIGSENICVGSTEDKCVGGQEGLIEAKSCEKMMDTATQVCVLSQDSSTKCIQISEKVTCPHDIADPLQTISTGEYHLVPASVQDSSSPEPNALSDLHNDMEKHNRNSLKRCFHDTGSKLSSNKEVPTKKCRRWHEEQQETSGIGVHGASIGNILQQFITEHQTVRQADKREGTACTHNQHLIAQIIYDFFNSLETVSLAQGHSFSLKHTEIPIEKQSVNVTHVALDIQEETQCVSVTHMAPETHGTQSMDVTHMAPDTDGTQSMGVTHMAPDTDGTQSIDVTHMAPDTDGKQSMDVTHMALDTDGTQSIGVTHMAPDTDGTQSMGVTHMAPDTDGTQSMDVTHMALDTDGTQSMGVTHMAPDTDGTQSMGVTHMAPDTHGTQSIGVTHLATDTDGTQSMGVTHMAPDTDGTQSMGVTHMASDTDGTQSMDVTHMAPDTDGTQSMGVTHMAPDTDGTQSIGVTHLATDTDGTQSMGVTHLAPDTDGTQSMGVTHLAPDTDGTQSMGVTPDAAENPPLPSTFSDDITSDPELEKIFSDEENVSKDSGLSETMPSPLQFQKYNETQKKPISSSSGESSSQTLNVHSKGIEEQQCAWAQSEHDVRLQLSKCQSVLREVSQVLSEIQGIDEDTMEQWRKGILDLQKESPLPKTHIAVVGETGAGKSSLLNALLEQEDLLPTSAMRACTAVVVEIEKSSVIGYKAEVEFLSKEEWEGELRALITDMKDKSGRFKKRPSDKPETQVAHSRVMAVYGKIAELDELKDDTTVTKYLGEKKQISENTASAFRSAIELYIDTNSEEPTQRNGGQIWPIVRCVRIFVPEADVLRTGAVLVDLPGTRDSNAARDRIAKEYLQKCDVVWVVTNITRAVDDKTAKEILTSNMRRQLLMDGHYESMAVICTKTDLYNTQEIKRALHLHDKTRNLEDNVVQLGHRLNTLEAERKTLYEQWEKGGTFAAESDPRNEILAKEKEIIDLKQQREESLRNINLICVSARNNYSKQRIRQDFYQSRQELEKGEDEADGEEEDEEERDAESNMDEEPSEGQTLRVFTVSSKEFLEVRRSALEGSTRLFNSERDTEIPDLRDYTIETALKCSMLGAERVIRNTACIISQIITYLLNRKAQDESHQAEIKLTVEKCLDDLLKQLTEAVSVCHEQMTFFIQKKIRGSLYKGVMCAKESCESIVRRWASRQSGGYSYPTYRATCVRHGYYSSPACGLIDFNEQLSQPITKEITKSWTEVFSGELVKCLSQFNQFVAKQLGAFFNNMKSLLVDLGTGYETIVSIEKQQLKSTQAELLHFFVDQKEYISHRQRHISRLLNPEVQQRMIEVYNECQSVRGAGSFERMKDLMTSHVNKEKHKIFGEAAESLMKQLNFLQTNIRESLNNFVKVRHQSLRQQCEPLLQPMKKEEEILPDLQNIWSHVSQICQRSQVDFHLPELEITPKPKPCDQDTRTLNRVEPPEITCLSNVKHILNCNTIKEPNQDVNTDHLILNPGPSSSALPPSLLLCRTRSSVSPHRRGFEKKSHVITNLTQQEPR